MNLHGSFQNRLLERDVETIPEIGMGATELLYSDRYPYTIVEILAKNKIVVQEDTMEHADTTPLSNRWTCIKNPEGLKKTLVKTKKGWKVLHGSTYFRLGVRDPHYDYSF